MHWFFIEFPWLLIVFVHFIVLIRLKASSQNGTKTSKAINTSVYFRGQLWPAYLMIKATFLAYIQYMSMSGIFDLLWMWCEHKHSDSLNGVLLLCSLLCKDSDYQNDWEEAVFTNYEFQFALFQTACHLLLVSMIVLFFVMLHVCFILSVPSFSYFTFMGISIFYK